MSSDTEKDPSGSTQQFRAFAQRETADGGRSNTPVVLGIAVAVIAVVAVLIAVLA